MNKFLFILFVTVCVSTPLAARAEDAEIVPEEILPAGIELAMPMSEPLAAQETSTSTKVNVAEASDAPVIVEDTATSTHEIVPELSPIPITLDIETPAGALFKGPIEVTACPNSPTSTGQTVSGYCAVLQSGVLATWSWYGSSAFIDSLGGTSNDYTASAYWNWFADLEFGMSALNEHQLHTGESLLITIGRLPLRLSTAQDAFSIGSTTTISVLQFGFDSNFNPVWEPAPESTVLINTQQYTTTASGTIAFIPITAEALTIVGTKDGYLPTATLSATVATSSEEIIAPPITIGGGGTESAGPHNSQKIAREFLLEHQRPNGSFRSLLISDWAAIALTSTQSEAVPLATYLRSSRNSLKNITDYERRAMALQALEVEPDIEIEHILNAFDGTQIGDPALINDDIFGIIPLLHAGYTANDPVIERTVAYLLQKQKSDGSFENTDLTAAAIQALVPLHSLTGVKPALTRAREYLVSSHQKNGCFGNSFTTSWSIMAITALGESPNDWGSIDGSTPIGCLRSLQASDGGFEEGASEDTRVWATAYALPALENQSWNSILHFFPIHKIVKVPPSLPLNTPLSLSATTTLPALVQSVELPLTSVTLEDVTEGKPPTPNTVGHVPSYSPRSLVASVGALDGPISNEPRQNFWSRLVALALTLLRMLRS